MTYKLYIQVAYDLESFPRVYTSKQTMSCWLLEKYFTGIYYFVSRFFKRPTSDIKYHMPQKGWKSTDGTRKYSNKGTGLYSSMENYNKYQMCLQ